MPVCFQLTRKGNASPSSFIEIDEEICKALGVPVDPKKYYSGWYDSIGLRLALGKSFNEIMAEYTNLIGSAGHDDYFNRMYAITEWLSKHYDSDSWREVGRA